MLFPQCGSLHRLFPTKWEASKHRVLPLQRTSAASLPISGLNARSLPSSALSNIEPLPCSALRACQFEHLSRFSQYQEASFVQRLAFQMFLVVASFLRILGNYRRHLLGYAYQPCASLEIFHASWPSKMLSQWDHADGMRRERCALIVHVEERHF